MTRQHPRQQYHGSLCGKSSLKCFIYLLPRRLPRDYHFAVAPLIPVQLLHFHPPGTFRQPIASNTVSRAFRSSSRSIGLLVSFMSFPRLVWPQPMQVIDSITTCFLRAIYFIPRRLPRELTFRDSGATRESHRSKPLKSRRNEA